MYRRKKKREVFIGSVAIGGENPIAVQSMTNTDTSNAQATVKQIRKLYEAGCEIVRVSIPDEASARALEEIKKASPIPVVADIHFNYKLAIASIEAGVDKVRINPGTLGRVEEVREVVMKAKKADIPIRIGVNAGSLPKKFRKRKNLPRAMVQAVLDYVNLFEEWSFRNLVLSVKASSVEETVSAYRLLSKKTDYPLHLGVTEAGPLVVGTVKSSLGIGILLSEGIGDTIRVSLTDEPTREIEVGWEILKALGLREGLDLISCPTCARCEIDVVALSQKVYEELKGLRLPLKVAVMGCVVNGPGEAREADIGVAGGKTGGVIFKKGKPYKKVSSSDLLSQFLAEVKAFLNFKLNTSSFPHHFSKEN